MLGLNMPSAGLGLGSKSMPIGPGVYLAAALGSTLLSGLFGGSDQQEMKPYTGSVAPQRSLEEAMQAIKGFGNNLERRGPAQLRSAVMPPPPAKPIRIPGLDVQIGGGLGMDPALLDRSILSGRGMGAGTATPFQSAFAGLSGPGGARGASLRTPDARSLDPNTPSVPGQARPRKPAGSSL